MTVEPGFRRRSPTRLRLINGEGGREVNACTIRVVPEAQSRAEISGATHCEIGWGPFPPHGWESENLGKDSKGRKPHPSEALKGHA